MPHTFRQEYVRCGKPTCRRCPHGPYWYEYWHVGGKMHKRYRGKEDPRPHAAKPQPQHQPAEHPDDAIFSKRTASAALAKKILGVSCAGDVSAINAAFRTLARLHHPDCGGDIRTFQRINAAYSYLKNVY